jgi:hypothetical protein
MSSVGIFSYVFTLPQKANTFISEKFLRFDRGKRHRTAMGRRVLRNGWLPGSYFTFSNCDGNPFAESKVFESAMAEGVASEPFLPSGDQVHKVGFATL